MIQYIQRQKQGKLFIVLLFLLLFAIGLFTIQDYGAPFDELMEMIILKFNIVEYAYHLEGADGDSIFSTVDVSRISETIYRDHGVSPTYLLIPFIGILVKNQHLFSVAWSGLLWCWFMLSCIALYHILRHMHCSKPVSIAGMLLLYLMPRFFAEGHYNNKDVMALSFVLITIWLCARIIDRPAIGRGLLFSLAGAVATNTRIICVLVWGLAGFAVLLSLTLNHRWTRKSVVAAVATVISFPLWYLLITPAAWDEPLELIRFILSSAKDFSYFDGTVIFRGATFVDITGDTPLPWYYILYWMLVTIPLYTVGLAVFGQAVAFRTILREKTAFLKSKTGLLIIIASLTLALPLLYYIVKRPPVYNGWRHFYFVYAGLVILAGYGLDRGLYFLRSRRILRKFFAGCIAGCLLFTGIGIVLNHPYEFAYFNVLLPDDEENYMDLDYWNVGFAGAFRQLYELKNDTEEELCIGCFFNDISIGALKLPDAITSRLILTTDTDAQYLCYNATYAYIYQVEEPPDGYHVLFEIESYGNVIITMYERDDSV